MESERPGLESWLPHVLDEGLWPVASVSLCLSFYMCEIGMTVVMTSKGLVGLFKKRYYNKQYKIYIYNINHTK